MRKKPPASGMFELSGPRPSFSSSSKFSGVRMPNRAGSSVVKLTFTMQWSWRLRPTGRFSRTGIPKSERSSSGPIPESMSRTGDWYAPAETITSRSARTVSTFPSWTTSTPTARSPSKTMRCASTLGAHLQVRPVRHRVQVRVGGRAALAVALVDLEAGDPLRAVDVEVGDVLVPGLHRRGEHRVDQRLHRAALRDGERPADTVEGILAALVVLGALEVREHLVVRPAGGAVRSPVVEVEPVAAEVDHRVDRAAAADHASARQVQPPTAEAGLLLAEQVPVVARLEQGRERERDADLGRHVRRARLEQQHARVRVLAQPPREHAARGAASDDHVVSHDRASIPFGGTPVHQLGCPAHWRATISSACTGPPPGRSTCTTAGSGACSTSPTAAHRRSGSGSRGSGSGTPTSSTSSRRARWPT